MTKELINILNRFKDKRIIVWGDFILDEYIYTTTGRISREAPVLVTEFDSNEFIPGGAGNVVMNIRSLGAVPIPVGLVDQAEDGATMKKILAEKDIATNYLVSVPDFKTPKKSRILSGGDHTKKQQVLRIDTINKTEIPPQAHDQITANLKTLLLQDQHPILIISDYIHQSVSPTVFAELRRTFPKATYIIDSRQHFSQFPGITFATPNEPEIKTLFPEKHFYNEVDFIDAGTELLERLEAEGIILKLGHKGMKVFTRGSAPQSIDIHGTSAIVDVTGAGDTVISVISLATACGADLFSAAQLANIAAGLVVMKEGAYAIPHHELKHELEKIL